MKVRKNEDVYYVFVAYITTRDGRRIFASNYGKKAFRIAVRKTH